MHGRIRRKRWPRMAGLIIVGLLLVCGWLIEERFLSPPGWQRPHGQLAAGEYDVDRVVDGDTIVLAHGKLRVRLQGIDTPETVAKNKPVEPWGTEASDYTSRFLKTANWKVQLTIDGEPVDRYGRHLAFVWHEGRSLNEELVQQGLARAKTTFDYSQAMKQRLRNAEFQAKSAQRGIWSNSKVAE